MFEGVKEERKEEILQIKDIVPPFYQDDQCFNCNQPGDLLCCDKCPHVFHQECQLGYTTDTKGKALCEFCSGKRARFCIQCGLIVNEKQQIKLICPFCYFPTHVACTHIEVQVLLAHPYLRNNPLKSILPYVCRSCKINRNEGIVLFAKSHYYLTSLQHSSFAYSFWLKKEQKDLVPQACNIKLQTVQVENIIETECYSDRNEYLVKWLNISHANVTWETDEALSLFWQGALQKYRNRQLFLTEKQEYPKLKLSDNQKACYVFLKSNSSSSSIFFISLNNIESILIELVQRLFKSQSHKPLLIVARIETLHILKKRLASLVPHCYNVDILMSPDQHLKAIEIDKFKGKGTYHCTLFFTDFNNLDYCINELVKQKICGAVLLMIERPSDVSNSQLKICKNMKCTTIMLSDYLFRKYERCLKTMEDKNIDALRISNQFRETYEITQNVEYNLNREERMKINTALCLVYLKLSKMEEIERDYLLVQNKHLIRERQHQQISSSSVATLIEQEQEIYNSVSDSVNQKDVMLIEHLKEFSVQNRKVAIIGKKERTIHRIINNLQNNKFKFISLCQSNQKELEANQQRFNEGNIGVIVLNSASKALKFKHKLAGVTRFIFFDNDQDIFQILHDCFSDQSDRVVFQYIMKNTTENVFYSYKKKKHNQEWFLTEILNLFRKQLKPLAHKTKEQIYQLMQSLKKEEPQIQKKKKTSQQLIIILNSDEEHQEEEKQTFTQKHTVTLNECTATVRRNFGKPAREASSRVTQIKERTMVKAIIRKDQEEKQMITPQEFLQKLESPVQIEPDLLKILPNVQFQFDQQEPQQFLELNKAQREEFAQIVINFGFLLKDTEWSLIISHYFSRRIPCGILKEHSIKNLQKYSVAFMWTYKSLISNDFKIDRLHFLFGTISTLKITSSHNLRQFLSKLINSKTEQLPHSYYEIKKPKITRWSFQYDKLLFRIMLRQGIELWETYYDFLTHEVEWCSLLSPGQKNCKNQEQIIDGLLEEMKVSKQLKEEMISKRALVTTIFRKRVDRLFKHLTV